MCVFTIKFWERQNWTSFHEESLKFDIDSNKSDMQSDENDHCTNPRIVFKMENPGSISRAYPWRVF
jgi:hypothetical protein